MPTYSRTQRFVKDYAALLPRQKAMFQIAVRALVEDLRRDRRFRKSLRVKGVQGAQSIFEMTWAPDGRATFQYGDEEVEGEPHVIWRRVGTHDVLRRP